MCQVLKHNDLLHVVVFKSMWNMELLRSQEMEFYFKYIPTSHSDQSINLVCTVTKYQLAEIDIFYVNLNLNIYIFE